jgi:hypothetical protein
MLIMRNGRRHFIMIQHFLPLTPTTSKMSYEIYRNTSPASSDADFHLIADMYERVMREDKELRCRRLCGGRVASKVREGAAVLPERGQSSDSGVGAEGESCRKRDLECEEG